jgi:poly-gamma-glutamate synthesis protein (capsule biosynthesis protein)
MTSTTRRSRTTALLLVLVVGFSVPALGEPALGAEGSPTPSSSADPGASTAGVSPPPAAAPQAGVAVPLVPVTDFWSNRRRIDVSELAQAIEGDPEQFRQVLVAQPHLDALAAALGVTAAPTTLEVPVDQIVRTLEGSRRTLGIMPASELVPTVRALGVGEATLVGEGRVDSLDAWPLMIPSAGASDSVAPFDPATTWTLAAAGDVMLDREVYRQAVILGKGPDFPWEGGYARIASRTCCNEFGGPEITARRAGRKGAVRRLLESADLTIVNHEGPAPDDFRFNPHGLRFSFDPSLEIGLARAGIDIVSLANNHIRDAGSDGVVETIANVREAGILTAGAGRDERAAREPACVERAGQRICVLAYDAVDLADAATGARPGAARLETASVKRDVWQARENGADVVVIVPHWGVEYVESRRPLQRRQAKAMVDAGADIVLGAHSHVVGAMETIRGVPVLYSMGNFIFDLTRFEQTLEGVIVELTFAGDRLLQIELHPTVLVDLSQPNLLDPEGDGRVVLRRMRQASKGLFP